MYKDFYNLIIKGYGHRPTMALICGLSGVTSFIEGFNVSLLIPLLDSLQSSDPESGHWISKNLAQAFEFVNVPFGLNSILVALGVLVVLGGTLKYMRFALVNKLRLDAIVWLQSKYMWSTLNGDVSYFNSSRLGAMSDTVIFQASRAAGTVGEVAESVYSITMIIAYLLAAFLISPALTAGALGVFLVVSMAMQYFVSRAEKISATLVQRDNDLQVSAIESLTAMQVVKSFRLELSRWADFNTKARQQIESVYAMSMNGALMVVIQEIIVFGIIGSIVFVAVTVMDLGLPVIVPLLYSLYRLLPRFAALNSMRHSLAGSMGSVRAISAGIDTLGATSVVSGKKSFARLEKEISVNAVEFSYNGGGNVLDGTSFNIEKGKMTAIVGASGAGKSTLIGILQRFYDPTSGYIGVDGVDLKDLDLISWRGSVGIVSQDIFLFNDTIANNISLARPGTTNEMVVTAAKESYSHDFIMQLPKGYETVIGDRGWNLSGGQRQRIALARAIIGHPEILILDEATSSLDSESEQLIQTYMTKIRGDCTVIVVAHRTATIRDADKIVVLQNGQIVEEGDWATLSNRPGVFATYQHLQTGG